MKTLKAINYEKLLFQSFAVILITVAIAAGIMAGLHIINGEFNTSYFNSI